VVRRFMFAVMFLAFPLAAQATEGTEQNMKDALSKLKSVGLPWKPLRSGLCLNDNFCEADVGYIQIQAVGWTVKALVTSQEPPSKYQKVCTAMFSGLAKTDIESSGNYVTQAFNHASSNGRAELEIADVELEVKAGSDSRLECGFTSYRYRRSR